MSQILLPPLLQSQLPHISLVVSPSCVTTAPPCVPQPLALPQAAWCWVSHGLLGLRTALVLLASSKYLCIHRPCSIWLLSPHCAWQQFVPLIFTQLLVFTKLVGILYLCKIFFFGQWDQKLQWMCKHHLFMNRGTYQRQTHSGPVVNTLSRIQVSVIKIKSRGEMLQL